MGIAAAAFPNWTTVAVHRSTRAGQKLETASGTEIGGYGADGRHFYKIEKRGVGEWRCSCPSNKFRKGPCKHQLSLFSRAKALIRTGALKVNDIQILHPEAF